MTPSVPHDDGEEPGAASAEERAAGPEGSGTTAGARSPGSTSRSLPRWKRLWLPALAVAIVAGALFSQAIEGRFVWDDTVLILKNGRNLDRWDDAYLSFARRAVDNERVTYYRPILMASYVIDYQLWGVDSRAFHRTDVLLHALTAALVYLLLFQLSGSLWAALLGALLYASHPLHGQAVALIMGRNDQLLAIPCLLALMTHRASERFAGGRLAAMGVLQILCFALALWTKETGVAMLGVLVAHDLLLGGSDSAAWRRRLPVYAAMLAVTGFYFWTRYQIFGFLLEGHSRDGIASPQRWLDSIAIAGYYAEKALWPTNLSGMPWSPSLGDPSQPVFWRAAFVCGTGVALTALCIWRWKLCAFGLLFFAIALSPVLGIADVKLKILEHRTYLPLVGLAVAITGALAAITPRRAALVAGSVVALLVVGAGVETTRRVPIYGSSWSLWATSVRNSPNSAFAHLIFGKALLARERDARALAEFIEARRLEPRLFGVRESIKEARRRLKQKRTEKLRKFLRGQKAKKAAEEAAPD